jgi:hypothetical protein
MASICSQRMVGGAHAIDQNERRIERQAAQRDV